MKPGLEEMVIEMKKLLVKVTPGPWEIVLSSFDKDRVSAIVTGNPLNGYETTYPENAIVITDAGVYPPWGADAEFIALSRTLIPELIAAYERLKNDDTHL